MCSAMVVFFFLLIAGPVWAEDFPRYDTVFPVSRCRAACLDEFSHIIRNEATCKKETECFMCWETCKMLNENFKLWGPMCAVRDICTPGCTFACKSIESYSNNGKPEPSVVNLKSVYDPERNYVNIEWITEQDIQSEGAILYVLLLKDSSQDWRVISQTTSHILKIRKTYLEQDTIIRLLGVNSTETVSDTEVSFLDSLLLAPMSRASYIRNNSTWKPRMQSMEHSKSSSGFLTTITWPKINGFKSLKYEVSWNVIDDSMEITGHLYTTTNVTVLTLWRDSIYSIQVKCYTSDEQLINQSEFLIIDTRSASFAESSASTSKSACFIATEPSVAQTICHIGILVMAIIGVPLILLFFKRKFLNYRKNYYESMKILRTKIISLQMQLNKAKQYEKISLSEKELLNFQNSSTTIDIPSDDGTQPEA